MSDMFQVETALLVAGSIGYLPREMSKECWCWLHVGLPTNWK